MLAPMFVVQHEENASAGVDLVPRRWLMVGHGEALADTSTDRDIQLVDPRHNDKVIFDNAVYTGVAAIGTDDLGDSYAYISGLFREQFDTQVSTDVTNPDVTGSKFLRVQESDQFRVTVD